ncbi:hypothetical protein ACIQVL_08845 [Streptomyces sp. NPDC090499]|uniref:hypothetical protein n=1 Tax=Streptomyces sp. NPDC090499 TaxID=3365965 RepID=UPI0037F335E7
MTKGEVRPVRAGHRPGNLRFPGGDGAAKEWTGAGLVDHCGSLPAPAPASAAVPAGRPSTWGAAPVP